MATATLLPEGHFSQLRGCNGDQHCCFAAAAATECLAAVERQTAMMVQVLALLQGMQGVLPLLKPEEPWLLPAQQDRLSQAEERNTKEAEFSHCDSAAVRDHQRAMHTLEAFSANKLATVGAEDLVAITRALGFEETFVGTVGEDLNTETVRYLFRGCDIDINMVPFKAFNKAMRELSELHSSMSSPSTAWTVPAGTVDFRSLEALGIVKEAESDKLSIASTFDRTSEAHTQSCSSHARFGLRERRPSLFTTQSLEEMSNVVRQLGGYSATLKMRSQVLGPLECIVIEPMGKQLAHARFVTTGVVICLHGLPPSHEVLQEWGQVLKLTKWLELGISVALPNLQMSAAIQQEDLEAVIEATLELMSFHRCIIAGKFWGAQRAVELAASERLAGKIDGLILVAPSSPAPSACSRLEVPVLLSWAHDDDTASFEEAEVWIKALDERCAPSMLQAVSTGGHRFDRILQEGDAAAAARRFTIATLMLATLENADEESECKRSQRIMRLSQDLPEFLQFNFEEGEDYDAEATPECVDVPEGPTRRLMNMLPQWIQAGVPTDSE